jgi:type I restriction enzyme S subunit
MRKRTGNAANVGRVSTRQTTPAHGDVGLRDEAANPTYEGMAGKWKRTSLREAGVSLIDCDHRTPSAAGSGYPYVAIPQLKQGRLNLLDVRHISPEHFVEWTRKAKPQLHDVILSRRCNPGETAYVPAGLECALGQNLVLLRSDTTKVFPPFLRWLVRGPDWWEQVNTFINVGAIFNSLKCADIPNFKMPLPPLHEQKAIAHILGTLDDKIELNRRMNATLEAMAQTLFQSWFVDFDPVRAKLNGHKPAGLDAATAALFPAHFQDSPLGHIPQGWMAGTLSEGFNLTMGQSPPGDTYNEDGNGIPFYQGRTDFGFRFPSRRIYCTAPTRFAKPGDTLVSVRAPVGDINMADEECCIGRGVAAVRHKSGAISFTYYAMANLYPDFALFEGEGTVFGSINKQNFENLRFVIPPPEVVVAYEQFAKPLDEQIRTLEHQSCTLATLRDALLPKLLSGELSVAVGTEDTGVVA